jgi:hypothetical protein
MPSKSRKKRRSIKRSSPKSRSSRKKRLSQGKKPKSLVNRSKYKKSKSGVVGSMKSRRSKPPMRSTLRGYKSTPIGMHRETLEFLGGWFSRGQEISGIPQSVHIDLADYLHRLAGDKSSVYLYRGLTPSDKDRIVKIDRPAELLFHFINSWTYSEEMANNFAETSDGKKGTVVKISVSEDQVFLDTTLFTEKFLHSCGGYPEEREVILNPGIYRVEFM